MRKIIDRSRARQTSKKSPQRKIVRIKFSGVGELVAIRGGFELRVYSDRAGAVALGSRLWSEGEMPMGRGCWSIWEDQGDGNTKVKCGKADNDCPEGCEIWESKETPNGYKWERTGKFEVITDKPGRFICGCKNQN